MLIWFLTVYNKANKLLRKKLFIYGNTEISARVGRGKAWWPLEPVDSAVGNQLLSRTDCSITFCIVSVKGVLHSSTFKFSFIIFLIWLILFTFYFMTFNFINFCIIYMNFCYYLWIMYYCTYFVFNIFIFIYFNFSNYCV